MPILRNIGFSVLGPTFAQIAVPEGIAGTVAQVGAIGISVWFVYHVTSIMLPKLNKDNNDLILSLMQGFKDEMRMERESHTLQMIAQRDECRREAGLLMQSFQLSLKRSSTTVEFVDSTSDSQILKGQKGS